MSRNITLYGNSYSTGCIRTAAPCDLYAQVRYIDRIIGPYNAGHTKFSGTLFQSDDGLYYCSLADVSAIYVEVGDDLSGQERYYHDCLFYDIEKLGGGSDVYKNCIFLGGGVGINLEAAVGYSEFYGCTFDYCGTAIQAGVVYAYDCTFSNLAISWKNGNNGKIGYFHGYNCTYLNAGYVGFVNQYHYGSFALNENSNGVEGDFSFDISAYKKQYTRTDYTIYPPGFDRSYKTKMGSADYYSWYSRTIIVEAGEKAVYKFYLRKTVSTSYLPRFIIAKHKANILFPEYPDLTVDTFTMTDSIDTWESQSITLDNTSNGYQKEFTVWLVSENTTGYVYSNYEKQISGGGGVKII